jgi:7-keto-8-aminopelargonate synthetase-like enzyme
MIGDEVETVSTAAKLRQLGIFIPAIRYPTVARGAARLRLTLTAAHTTADIQQLMAALGGLNLALRPSHFAPRSHAPAG